MARAHWRFLEPTVPPEERTLAGTLLPHSVSTLGDYFLAAYSFDPLIGEPHANAANMFGLYLVDRFGNKELIYRDVNIGSLWPTPLRARSRPPAPGVYAERDAPGRRDILRAKRLRKLAETSGRRDDQATPDRASAAEDDAPREHSHGRAGQCFAGQAGSRDGSRRARWFGVFSRPRWSSPLVPGAGRTGNGGSDHAEPDVPPARRACNLHRLSSIS